MKKKFECTFMASKQFKAEFAGKNREFIEMHFLVHNANGYVGTPTMKVLTTVEKLRKALEYRKMQPLELNKRYDIWLQDYKGDKKLKFSGIVEVK